MPRPYKKRYGLYLTDKGYLYRVDKDGKKIREHRRIMEEHLGRKLLPGETVHHKNGVRADNRLENLELWTSNHPSGSRVEDKIEWALGLLRIYAPEKLVDHQ